MRLHPAILPLALVAAAACSDRDGVTDPALAPAADDLASGRRAVGAGYQQCNNAAGTAVRRLPPAPDGTPHRPTFRPSS